MGQITDKICPKCGAPLTDGSISINCEFCGYIDSIKPAKIATLLKALCYDIEARYNRFPIDMTYIRESGFVKVEQVEDYYRFRSTPIFHPIDGFNLFAQIGLDLECTYKRNSVTLICHVYGDYSSILQPTIVFSTCDNKISKAISIIDSDIGFFDLNISDYFELCKAKTIDVDTNLCSEDLNFEELSTYVKRFAHLLFFSDQYRYSIYKHLLTDKTL